MSKHWLIAEQDRPPDRFLWRTKEFPQGLGSDGLPKRRGNEACSYRALKAKGAASVAMAWTIALLSSGPAGI